MTTKILSKIVRRHKIAHFGIQRCVVCDRIHPCNAFKCDSCGSKIEPVIPQTFNRGY